MFVIGILSYYAGFKPVASYKDPEMAKRVLARLIEIQKIVPRPNLTPTPQEAQQIEKSVGEINALVERELGIDFNFGHCSSEVFELVMIKPDDDLLYRRD